MTGCDWFEWRRAERARSSARRAAIQHTPCDDSLAPRRCQISHEQSSEDFRPASLMSSDPSSAASTPGVSHSSFLVRTDVSTARAPRECLFFFSILQLFQNSHPIFFIFFICLFIFCIHPIFFPFALQERPCELCRAEVVEESIRWDTWCGSSSSSCNSGIRRFIDLEIPTPDSPPGISKLLFPVSTSWDMKTPCCWSPWQPLTPNNVTLQLQNLKMGDFESGTTYLPLLLFIILISN